MNRILPTIAKQGMVLFQHALMHFAPGGYGHVLSIESRMRSYLDRLEALMHSRGANLLHLLISVSRFALVLLLAFYTYSCFAALKSGISEERQDSLYFRQTACMYLILFLANGLLFLSTFDGQVLVMTGMELAFFIAVSLIYKHIYRNASLSVTNNMCMLLAISFIILTRLDIGKAYKQLIIACVALGITCLIPLLVEKLKFLNRLTYLYALAGIAGLGIVAVAGSTSYGAKLSLSIGGISIQPSEFIKILFVFFAASMLWPVGRMPAFENSPYGEGQSSEDGHMGKSAKDGFFAGNRRAARQGQNRGRLPLLAWLQNGFSDEDFRRIEVATAVAGLHVLMLIASRDLGGAGIFLITYLVMLYAATRRPLFLGLGFAGGAAGMVLAYFLFGHVRNRVAAWLDPLAVVDTAGYQVSHSLFAIGTGGWFGSGLYQGMPEKIPVVEKDFVFSAISEELGAVFALCLIFICISCFLMFFNIAMQIRDPFYKLIALGLGTVYATQTFLTLGGVTRFIPSTGVTLPLVSYGGSSLLSTMILFAIIQGLYVLREESSGRK